LKLKRFTTSSKIIGMIGFLNCQAIRSLTSVSISYTDSHSKHGLLSVKTLHARRGASLGTPCFEVESVLADAFIRLAGLLVNDKCTNPFGVHVASHIMDSMPIVVASSKRSGSAKAASGLCSKGYCSSKNMYYYGIKLHILGEKQYKALPSPRMMEITSASTNDLTHAKSMLSQAWNIEIFADKIYLDAG